MKTSSTQPLLLQNVLYFVHKNCSKRIKLRRLPKTVSLWYLASMHSSQGYLDCKTQMKIPSSSFHNSLEGKNKARVQSTENVAALRKTRETLARNAL